MKTLPPKCYKTSPTSSRVEPVRAMFGELVHDDNQPPKAKFSDKSGSIRCLSSAILELGTEKTRKFRFGNAKR